MRRLLKAFEIACVIELPLACGLFLAVSVRRETHALWARVIFSYHEISFPVALGAEPYGLPNWLGIVWVFAWTFLLQSILTTPLVFLVLSLLHRKPAATR
jgi:hypothetical protein